MQRITKIGVWAAGSVLVLFVLLESALYVANLLYVRRAEQLLKEASSLRVNLSTEADAHRILDKYGPTVQLGGSNCSVSNVSAAVTSYNLKWLGAMNPAPRLFGNRVWGAVVSVQIDRGVVCGVHYAITAGLPELRVNGGIDVYTFDVRAESPLSSKQSPYSVHFRVYNGFRQMRAELNPNATAADRQHAFDFELSCLTRVGGCRQPCEMQPSVWSDVVHEASVEGWDLPADELADPRCSQLAAFH